MPNDIQPKGATVTDLIRLARLTYAQKRHDEDQRLAVLLMLQRSSEAREIIDACKVLSTSSDATERVLASDILAAVSHGEARAQPEQAVSILVLLAKDEELSVRCAALLALGRWGVPHTEHLVISAVDSPSAREREAATRALAGFDSIQATNTLIGLLASADTAVRHWAILGLDSRDSVEIRDGLLSVARHGNLETREEALLALAERRDSRVVPILQRHLETSNEIGTLAVQAASEVRSGDLYSALVRLRDWWDLDSELLEEAIENSRRARMS